MSEDDSTTETFIITSAVSRAVLVSLLHLLALIACWMSGIVLMVQSLLTVFLLVSLYVQLMDYNDINYIRLRFSEQSGWELAVKGESYRPIRIGSASVITRWVMVLYCGTGLKERTVVVFRDSLAEKQYRKLLALIKTTGL